MKHLEEFTAFTHRIPICHMTWKPGGHVIVNWTSRECLALKITQPQNGWCSSGFPKKLSQKGYPQTRTHPWWQCTWRHLACDLKHSAPSRRPSYLAAGPGTGNPVDSKTPVGFCWGFPFQRESFTFGRQYLQKCWLGQRDKIA